MEEEHQQKLQNSRNHPFALFFPLRRKTEDVIPLLSPGEQLPVEVDHSRKQGWVSRVFRYLLFFIVGFFIML